MLRVSWTEHHEQTKVSLQIATSRICCAQQALLLRAHNQGWQVRPGEVGDSGESEPWETTGCKTFTVSTSQNRCLRTWAKSRGTHGIALNGEYWYDGRLIITLDGP